MTKKPLLCASHTIKGTATIRARNTVPTDYQLSLSNVRLWTDPLYGTALKVVDSPCLLGRLAYLLEALTPDAQTYTKTYFWNPTLRISFPTITASVGMALRGNDTGTNDAGRLILRRLGLPPYENLAASGSPVGSSYCGGLWASPESESGDLDETQRGFGNVIETRGGTAYTFNIGQPLPSRMLNIEMVDGQWVVPRDGSTIGRTVTADRSFKRSMWEWLSIGEAVRYYADTVATHTYLTAACAKEDQSITVASTTGFTDGHELYLDGEKMEIYVITSGTTMSVLRDKPVAHVKYAPVSTDFVGTYVLSKDGGNINRNGFRPKLRMIESDFYDMEIPLIRTAS